MARFSVAGKRRRHPVTSNAGPSSTASVYPTHEGGDTAEEEEEGPDDEEHFQQGSTAGPSASNGSGTRLDSSDWITVSIDPDVLDCAICYEPLAAPIFQCSNGHIACSSCCGTMQKCHSCQSQLGPSRCLALEKVLESIRVPCPHVKHGCRASIVYSQRQSHVKSCLYSPCACPLSSCTFEGTLQQLTSHFNSKHRECATDISYNLLYHVSFDMMEKGIKILRGVENGVLYVLSGTNVLPIGKSLSLTCIHPEIQGSQQQQYELSVKHGGSSLRLLASIASVERWKGTPPSKEFLLVPFNFFDDDGTLDLELCIHSMKRQEG